MSGHSKWHNIQAKKGKADAQRGAVFTKIGREIAIAVREGGANPESNGKLRDIIAKAKANNMPAEHAAGRPVLPGVHPAEHLVDGGTDRREPVYRCGRNHD